LIVVVLGGVFSFAAWQAMALVGVARGSEPGWQFVLESAFTVGLVALAFFRYLLIRTRGAELMAQPSQAAAGAIRPHFLFNSLAHIASLIRQTKERQSSIEDQLTFSAALRRADWPPACRRTARLTY
jgi:hypothetical protein